MGFIESSIFVFLSVFGWIEVVDSRSLILSLLGLVGGFLGEVVGIGEESK